MSGSNDLLRREAAFWDRQEEAIASIYGRPHDWRFVPELAERIMRPKYRFIERALARVIRDGTTHVEIGCGNGWFCHALARRGVRSWGIDISPKKIDVANEQAEALGVADRCTFIAGDALDFEPPAPVDLITSLGSLHHFPALATVFPRLVDGLLRPDGAMLFSEPNHEGMPRWLEGPAFRLARSKRFGRYFDHELYAEMTRPPEGESDNVRQESPAGEEFFGEEQDLDAIFSRYEVVHRRKFHYFVGHSTNVGHVFMKPRWIRTLTRWTLPAAVLLDDLACRIPPIGRRAEEGVWVLRNRPA